MQTVNDKAYRVDVIDKIIEYLIKLGRIYGTFGIKHTTLRYLTEDEFDKFKKGQFTLPHKKPLKPEDCLRKIGIQSNP